MDKKTERRQGDGQKDRKETRAWTKRQKEEVMDKKTERRRGVGQKDRKETRGWIKRQVGWPVGRKMKKDE